MPLLTAQAVTAVEDLVSERLRAWPEGWEGYHWPGYTWEHTQRVRSLALTLADREGADPQVVELAALLHDIRKADGHAHAETGAREADQILRDLAAPAALRKRVRSAIANHAGLHSVSTNAEDLCLADADLMDANLGLVGVWRYVTIRAGHGVDLQETVRALGDWMTQKITILESLRTRSGRELGRCRAARMRVFCEETVALARVAGRVAVIPGMLEMVRYIHEDCGRRLLTEELATWETIAGEIGADTEFAVACRALRAEVEGRQ